ncbi:MAG: VWA domain-containing protein [Muribaculaceae bacterium]|nr:VWA domain-containing protein [Muribaculaceae bacterium]MDE6575513.1 VWA domain-containing protein [Muribaculaceae bacterium]
MHFAHPSILWGLLLIIPLTVWYVLRLRKGHASISVSTTSAFANLPRSPKQYLRHLLFILRMATIACLIVVMARPQLRDSWRTTSTEGTDIVLAMDVSSSMLARDFEPDRFGAAKDVAAKFISGRESDNIGIVIFAGESLTGVPMTVDRQQLLQYLQNLNMNMLEDGTAIGDGIATALNRLKEGKAKSKSIILLTDGSNNTGVVAPITAAEVAKELGVKIYTIGIGTNGNAPFPTRTLTGRIEFVPQPVVIDEPTLKTIAESTGGKYFRATGNKVLQEVFQEIDALEKTQMDVRHFSHTEDNYIFWGWLAFGFFVLELLLRYTVLRSIP